MPPPDNKTVRPLKKPWLPNSSRELHQIAQRSYLCPPTCRRIFLQRPWRSWHPSHTAPRVPPAQRTADWSQMEGPKLFPESLKHVSVTFINNTNQTPPFFFFFIILLPHWTIRCKILTGEVCLFSVCRLGNWGPRPSANTNSPGSVVKCKTVPTEFGGSEIWQWVCRLRSNLRGFQMWVVWGNSLLASILMQQTYRITRSKRVKISDHRKQ